MTATWVPKEPAARIRSAREWTTNGELIAAVAELGHIQPGDRVIDPTYENGLWWTDYRPNDLTTHHRDVDGSDFRDLPYEDDTFDVAAYDPPFISIGSREKSTIKDFNDRYGLDDAPRTPNQLQQLINAGLTELARIVKPGGRILAKNMNYISSGNLQLGTFNTITHGLSLGLTVEDWLIMVGHPGAQPKRSRCAWCNHPIQRTSQARGSIWKRMQRAAGVDNETCRESPHLAHDPNGDNLQAHADQNASHLIVFSVPNRKPETNHLPPSVEAT